MAQITSSIIRKPKIQMFTEIINNISRHSPQATNDEQDNMMTRVCYPIHQPGTQGRKIFGFEIFVDNDVLRELHPEKEWLEKIKKAGDVESINFNLSLSIPELNGRNVQIYDKQMEKKYQSCKVLLSDIYQVFKKLRREQLFSIIIFVPEGMISLLIGTKGYQINKIMRESHTIIVVNQPINKMTYRTVKIQGSHSDISKACRIIYEILEDKSSIAYSIEKEPSQLDYSKARVKTKFLLCSSLIAHLLNKKKAIIKRIEEQTKCAIKFKEQCSSRFFKQDEELCVLMGRLEDVQAFIVMLINIIQIHRDLDRKNHDFTFKMLIPSNYVTKLIGQKGYMIKDITQRSGGAKIKIESDRHSERDAKEIIIAIDGTRENKIDATCLILEQIECFKNGGPILQSGKSINENLAQQFKNSLPLHKGDESVNESTRDRHRRSKEDDNHDEEGQIEVEEGEEVSSSPLHQREDERNRSSMQLGINNNKESSEPEPRGRQAIGKAKAQSRRMSRSSSELSDESGSSASRSRKKTKRSTEKSSSSSSYFQDKWQLQLKMVVPRALAKDHEQLKYIGRRSQTQISIKDQKVQSGESVICIKGRIKDNSQCVKMLSKRLLLRTSTR